MKIGILSDSHDNIPNIKKAVELFMNEKVEAIIHAGDFVAPFSIRPIAVSKICFISVFGNNDGEKRMLTDVITKFGGKVHEQPYVFELAGKKFLLMHILMADYDEKAKEFGVDYCIYGHNHIAKVEQKDGYLLINPGECGGWLKGIGGIATLDTDTNECRIIEISRGEGLEQ